MPAGSKRFEVTYLTRHGHRRTKIVTAEDEGHAALYVKGLFKKHGRPHS